MSSLPKKHFYTLEEYFALVKDSDARYEYWHGEIFCMSGSKKNHIFIEEDIFRTLSKLLEGCTCQPFSSALAIKVPLAPPFRYADGSVVCGEPQFEEIGGIDTLVNPILITEVLSPSTKRYDLNTKFQLYKSIESFQEYLLIDQDSPCITQYVKQSNEVWQPDEITGLGNSIYLPSIDCTLQLSDVYRRINFEGK